MTIKNKNATTNKNALKLDNLLAFIQKNYKEASLQTETDQIVLTIKVKKIEFPFFIRITNDKKLIQLLVFFPCNIKDGSEADTARCLHLLNKELDVPGFGMDDVNGLMFYRYMIPCENNEFVESIVDRFMVAVPGICESFFPLIYNISQGTMKFSEIADKLTELIALPPNAETVEK